MYERGLCLTIYHYNMDLGSSRTGERASQARVEYGVSHMSEFT